MNDTSGGERLLNRTYLSLFIINLIVAIGFSMVITSISLYVTSFGASVAVAGAIVGSLSVASMFVRPFSGILSDQMNRKRLLTFALAGCGLAMAGCGLTKSIPLLFTFRILHGVAFSLASTVTMALVADSVPHAKMAQGLGYFATGQTIAAAFAPTLGLWIGERFGFSVTFFSAALLTLGAVFAAAFLIPASGKKRFRPDHRLTFSDFISREALPFAALAIVVSGSTGLENGFVAIFGRQLDLGNVGWYFTIGAAALFLSRVFGGKFADRYGAAVLYAGIGLMIAAFGLLGAATIGNAAVVFAVAAVLKALGLGVVQPALQAGSMKSVSVERRGAASCTYYLGADIGQAMTPMAGGLVAGIAGYGVMFSVYVVPLLLGIAFLIWLGRRKAL